MRRHFRIVMVVPKLVLLLCALIVCSPMLLVQFAVGAIQHRIESSWPESRRARAASFWIGLLAPVALIVAMAVLSMFAIKRTRERVERSRAAVAAPKAVSTRTVGSSLP